MALWRNQQFKNKYKVKKFLLVTDILKSNISLNGSSEKKHMLDQSRENLLINEVEKIWEQISLHDNWNVLEHKIQRLRALGNILESKKIINF